MLLKSKILTFIQLGEFVLEKSNIEQIKDLARSARNQNGWFTEDNVLLSLENIAKYYLNEDALNQFVGSYPSIQNENNSTKNVGIIMAGNIPAVGFHDLLCVVLSGNKVSAKLSSTDSILMKFLVHKLFEINPEIKNYIEFVERLNDVDALIATGSDNSAKHFDYYFAKKPHIIRRNRTSVAIIRGDENRFELSNLGNDIFQYFGLGCRNVSKFFVPEGYKFDKFYESIDYWSTILLHHKYQNNYDYNKSIYLVNRNNFLDNGFLLVKEDEANVSPISVVFFQYYKNEEDLNQMMLNNAEKIQCIVSKNAWYKGSVDFGQAQTPKLNDFADNVDTMEFLLSL